MVKLILVRHGETDANKPPRFFQGQMNTKLNEHGIYQSNKLAQKLYECNQASSKLFDAIHCSDLERTKQTLVPYLMLRNIPDSQINYDKSLRERDSGDLTGKFVKEVQDELNPGETILGLLNKTGERDEVFRKRVLRWLHGVLLNYSNEHEVLAITHGGVIAELLHIIFPNKAHRMPRNTSVYTLILELSNPESKIIGRKYVKVYEKYYEIKVVSLNCTKHLDPGFVFVPENQSTLSKPPILNPGNLSETSTNNLLAPKEDEDYYV